MQPRRSGRRRRPSPSFGPPLTIDPKAPESERRLALARWIGHPDNPLTARVHGQPRLAVPLRPGPGRARRATSASTATGRRTPSCSTGWPSEFVAQRLAAEAAAPADRAVGDLPPVGPARRRRRWPSTGQPAAVADDRRAGWRPRRSATPCWPSAASSTAAWAARATTCGSRTPTTSSSSSRRRRWGRTSSAGWSTSSSRASQQDATFGAFDCPDAALARPRRNVSTTALQALNLFNGHFLVDQAEAFAGRLERDAGPDAGRQATRAFQLAFARKPTEVERKAAVGLILSHDLRALCRAIYTDVREQVRASHAGERDAVRRGLRVHAGGGGRRARRQGPLRPPARRRGAGADRRGRPLRGAGVAGPRDPQPRAVGGRVGGPARGSSVPARSHAADRLPDVDEDGP